jgi:cell fate regulator YaaT (PSP1 superfamily)
VVEVRFKANRKGFYRRSSQLEIQVGDVVAVDADHGCDVGVVSLRGELVKAQMSAKRVKDDHEIRKVSRKATQEDIDTWQKASMREAETISASRKIIRDLGLQMKLADVEFQGDNKKATFYYTAEVRVDFRLLVRDLAAAFGIRVEMRQIGARQEAARVGGIGVCGRELCCSSWLKDFRSVSTSAARYQQMSLNPQKLSGQCGKLKCCLNFELDQYVEAVSEFPSPNAKIKLKEGRAFVFKMDIFKRLVYLNAPDGAGNGPVAVSLEDMKELMAMNERGEYPVNLKDFMQVEEPDEVDEVYSNVVGQDSVTRFDESKRNRKKRSGRRNQGKKRPNTDTPKQSVGGSKSPQGEAKPNGEKPQRSKRRPNERRVPKAPNSDASK